MKNIFKKYFDRYIGWFGLFLLISNISFVSFGFTKTWYTPEMYLIVNLIGSAAIAHVSLLKKAFEPFWLNIFAIIVTILGYIFQKI